MKQRAIIAMALACNAQIIIADEPTTALDVTIQAQIMNILGNIKKDVGTAILLITHDLALVKDSADEISVMYSGRIVEKAPTAEFFANTNHPYSKALLKSLPSEKADKGEKLAIIEGQPPSIQQEIGGCKFHPRCRYAMPACSKVVPELKEITKGHFSACHLN
jgi:oligopeptide/dipeptide ABC transporter ATP-binding protein